jgi:hypothetical protein
MGIILSRNPVQGGSVVIRVSFRDELGRYYIPVKGTVNFSLCALHKDKETWEIVNNRHGSLAASKSVVDLVLQGGDLALLPGCTTQRRVVLDWKYMRDGELTFGRDTVDFDVVPLPVLDPEPGEDPVPPLEPFVLEDVFVVRESRRPRIALRFNCPVDEGSVGTDSFSLEGDGAGAYSFGAEYSGDKRTLYITSRDPLVAAGEWVLKVSQCIKSVLGVPLSGDSGLEFPLSVSWFEPGVVSIPVKAGVSGVFVVYDPDEGVFVPFEKGVHDQGPGVFVAEAAAEGDSVGYVYGEVSGYSFPGPWYSKVYLGDDGTLRVEAPEPDSRVVGFVLRNGVVYLYPPA